MNNVKICCVLALLASMPAAQADVYDILRNKERQSNLTLEDVQGEESGATGTGSVIAPPVSGPAPTTLREEAFKELLNKTFPLQPEQIQKLHRQYDDSQKAINAPAYAPPLPMSSTINVDLSPGGTPPLLRLATGFVTSIVFIDATGQPWPVADYSLGNPGGFNIKWDNKTNTLFIQSMKDHVSGNMAVRLAELETPIMISIVTGQREVDYRVDCLVPGNGPNASAPVVDNPIPSGASSALLGTLDGVPPSGSVELNVAKEYGRAWLHNGKLLFRTKLTVLSPAWSASVSSPDGTKVYELMQTPLILASQNGKTVKIELSGL